MKILIIFLTFFSLSSTAPSNAVIVAKVIVHCKLEVTSKIECFLPQSTMLTEVVEIVSSIAFTTTELSDEEVNF